MSADLGWAQRMVVETKTAIGHLERLFGIGRGDQGRPIRCCGWWNDVCSRADIDTLKRFVEQKHVRGPLPSGPDRLCWFRPTATRRRRQPAALIPRTVVRLHGLVALPRGDEQMEGIPAGKMRQADGLLYQMTRPVLGQQRGAVPVFGGERYAAGNGLARI